MANTYDRCGCDESLRLREAIRQYIENNDDTGLRCEYGSPLPHKSHVISCPPNQIVAQAIRDKIKHLDYVISESKKTMSYSKDLYEKALFELGVAERDRGVLTESLDSLGGGS